MKIALTRALEAPAIEETRKHAFLTATPDQIRNYVDTHVTSLATAKTVLAELAIVVSALARRMER